MHSHIASLASFALAAATLIAPAASQVEYWIDPVDGSNSASGTSASDPLRTIRRALLPGMDAAVIHLAPGVYSAATGELFPITLPDGLLLEGTEGAASTILESGVDEVVLTARQRAEVRGVRLQGTNRTVVFGLGGEGTDRPRLADCEVVGGENGASGSLILDRCLIEQQTRNGISVYGDHMSVYDSVIRDSALGSGLRVTFFWYDDEDAEIDLVRCSITGHARHGLEFNNLQSLGSYTVRVHDCVVAGNGISGIHCNSTDQDFDSVFVEGTTVAGNVSYGLVGSPGLFPFVVRSSIVAGSGVEDVFGVDDIASCLIEDGTGPAGNGNLSGAPGFVAPSQEDFQLRFDSPAVDRGIATTYGRDLTGRARAVDGDLDLVSAPDMGAFEHATLVGPGTAQTGGFLPLGVTGPAGGFSTIVIAPQGYAPFGASTIYGRLFLAPQGSYRVQPVATTGGAPTYIDLSGELDPAWVGTSIGFQALTRSTAAPNGGAFSNPLLIDVVQ